MRKKLLLCSALCLSLAQSTFGLSFDQNIVAIFGSGNPDTGWTTETGEGITVALRGKNRATAETANVNGTYSFPTGVQPATVRAIWNWEFSINSGAQSLADAADYYIAIDLDPSQGIGYTTIDALSIPDNSYGNDSTLNGQGIEGLASDLASLYNISQQSHNITFGAYGLDANQNATYDYELYAVEKGSGPGGTRLVSVGITVVVGTGGDPIPDGDQDGVPDNVDQCPETAVGQAVNTDGCSIQDLVNLCAVVAESHGEYVSCITHLAKQLHDAGIINNKQRQELIVTAAKSDVGN